MELFNNKFRIIDLSIAELDYWIISLRPEQPTLGSLILSLKRQCKTFGELRKEEAEELSKAYHLVESLLSKAFEHDKINYLALMMVDEQVHFHVIPRYEKERKFQGKSFIDPEYPKPPNLFNSYNFSEQDLLVLSNFLKLNI